MMISPEALLKKDWTGTSDSVGKIMCAKGHTDKERAEHDLYTTDQVDFVRFLKALKRDGLLSTILKDPIWEPSAGLGCLVEVLQKMNKTVIASDLVDRRDWDNSRECVKDLKIIDFMEHEVYSDSFPFSTILTNPPFSICVEYVRKALSLLATGEHLVLLLRMQFLEGAARWKLFQESPYKYVYCYTKRARCYHNGSTENASAMQAFCWFIWEKGWTGDPILKFIE